MPISGTPTSQRSVDRHHNHLLVLVLVSVGAGAGAGADADADADGVDAGVREAVSGRP